MNMPTGFLRFQAMIDEVTQDIGEPTLRTAIAEHFMECLKAEMIISRNLRYGTDMPYRAFWTMATASEFEAGASRGEATLSRPKSKLAPEPVDGQSRWRGTWLRLRGGTVYAEGGRFRLTAARCFEGHTTYDYKLRQNVTKWQVSLDSEFYASSRGHWIGHASKKMTSHAGSQAAGIKAMRRMVKDFYGIDL